LTLALSLPGPSVHAANKTWNNTGTDFNASGSWTGGVPGTGDTAVFSTAEVSNPNLSASLTILALNFSTTSSSGYDLTSSSTSIKLTLNSTATGTGSAINAANTSGTNTIDAPIVLGASANKTQTFTQASGGTLVINGIISSTNNVTLSLAGGGIIQLDGANTYSGGTTLAGGTTVRINNATALGTGTFTIQGGTIDNTTASSLTLTNDNVIAISGNFTFGGTQDLNLGNGAVTDDGNYTITLSGTGSTLTLGGTMTNTLNGVQTTTVNGAGNTLVLGSYALSSNNTGRIDIINGTGNVTITGAITNGGTSAGGLIYSGTGTLTLSGNNTYGGATSISSGIVNIQNANALGSTASGTTVSSGATLQLQGGITFAAEALTISGTGGAGQNGALVNVSGINNYGGLLTLAAGTTLSSNSGTLNLTNTGTIIGATFSLTLTGSGDGSISSVIGTTSGALTKSGSGTWTLNAANTYTGLTTITAGTLAEGVSNAISTGALTINGATAMFDLSANHTDSVGTVILDGGGSINGTGTSALTSTGTFEMKSGTVTAILAGSGIPLNKTTTGTVTLLGADTYTGATTISAGILNIQNDTALGSTASGTTVSSGATLQLQGGITVGAETLNIQGIGASGQNGALVNVSGTNNYGGLVTLGAATTISSDSGTINITNAGTITGSGFNLTLTGSGDGSISSIIGTGSGTLTKSGSGTWTLSGANTFTGSTTINGGSLILAASGSGALGSTSSITINSGGTLLLGASNQINNSAPMTLAGGTFAKGNFSEGSTSTAGVGALTLTATGSHLDFGTGTVGTLTFASFSPGTNILIIDNWTGTANTIGSASTDRLVFNSDQSSNLSDFWFTGYAPGASEFSLGGGYYEIAPTVVPEPSTCAGAALALGIIAFHCRRRKGIRSFTEGNSESFREQAKTTKGVVTSLHCYIVKSGI